jgi:hypothetical protein
MLFSELALQGVRGFSPSVRAAFKQGYWVLQAPGAAPLGAVLLELCFPSGADKKLLAPDAPQGKMGLLLQGNDQLSYRVIRQLGGGGALHRAKPPATAYELVTQDPQEISQALRAPAGMPDRGPFESLFCFAPYQLPSRRPPPAKVADGAPKVAAQSPWAQMLEGGGSTMDPALKLLELEKELSLCTEVEKLQYRFDALTSEAYQVEDLLRSTDPLETQLREAQAAFLEAPTPEKLGLPPDVVQHAERMPAIEAKLAEGLSKLAAEREDNEQAAGAIEPPWRNRQFLAGLGVGALALVGGALGTGAVRYVALLDMPAFGFAAFFAWRFVDDLAWAERISRREGRMVDRDRKLREQYEAEAAAVKAAIKMLDLETPKQLLEAFGARAQLAPRVQELEAALAAKRAEPAYVQASSKLAKLKQEQTVLQEELTQKGAYVRDARDVQRDIEKVRAAISTGVSEVNALSSAPKVQLVDPCPALFAQAAALFGIDVASLAGVVRDRSSQYFAALTERRWTGLEFAPDGSAAALGTSGKSPLILLSPADVDWAYLSVRFTIVEKYGARAKVPVVIEPFLEGLDERRNGLLARMLKHLGSLGQVLHVTPHAAFAKAADGQVSV